MSVGRRGLRGDDESNGVGVVQVDANEADALAAVLAAALPVAGRLDGLVLDAGVSSAKGRTDALAACERLLCHVQA
jgi:hypothetical protein